MKLAALILACAIDGCVIEHGIARWCWETEAGVVVGGRPLELPRDRYVFGAGRVRVDPWVDGRGYLLGDEDFEP